MFPTDDGRSALLPDFHTSQLSGFWDVQYVAVRKLVIRNLYFVVYLEVLFFSLSGVEHPSNTPQDL